ncbi:MAG: type IX secretion system membrane protein PorP/SprF [Chitinophagales bacterium]
MKRIITFILILFFTQEIYAQQVYQLTHYMINDFAFNPAVAGSDDTFVGKASFRKQWSGIDGAPTTGMVSMHGNLSENRTVGIGAILYSDNTGPIGRTGATLAYAYQLPLVENETYLGIGVGANLMSYKINFNELITRDEGDPQIGAGDQSKMGADANLGLYLKGLNFWAGLSVNQMFASKYTFVGDVESIENSRHIFLGGGVTFNASENLDIAPSILLKSVAGAGAQFELGARAIVNKNYWAGISYRTEDALAILVGLQLDSSLNLAYSYDITTSDLSNYTSGTHEITVGYNFDFFNRKAKKSIPSDDIE